MMIRQKSWWLAVLVGGLAATAVVMVRAAPGQSKLNSPGKYPNAYSISKGGSDIPQSGTFYSFVTCGEPQVVLGGGYDFDVPGAATAIESRPFTDPDNGLVGWRVDFQSNGGSGYAWVYAICADQSIFTTR